MEEDATNAPKDMARDKTPLTFRVLFTITKGDRGASNCLKRVRGSVGVKLFVRRSLGQKERDRRGKGKEGKRKKALVTPGIFSSPRLGVFFSFLSGIFGPSPGRTES